jgi:hypothetical protein
MATEIVHWCDVHLAQGERLAVTARHAVTLDGAPMVVELCEVCESSVFKPLSAFLVEHGVPERVAGKPVKASKVPTPRAVSADVDGRTLIESRQGRPRPSDGRLYPCLVCEGVVEGRSRFDAHLRDEHNTTSPQLYGDDCPMCGHTAGGPVGLAAHGRGTHEVQTVFSLFDLARREGDPLGIVTSRLAGIGADA